MGLFRLPLARSPTLQATIQRSAAPLSGSKPLSAVFPVPAKSPTLLPNSTYPPYPIPPVIPGIMIRAEKPPSAQQHKPQHQLPFSVVAQALRRKSLIDVVMEGGPGREEVASRMTEEAKERQAKEARAFRSARTSQVSSKGAPSDTLSADWDPALVAGCGDTAAATTTGAAGAAGGGVGVGVGGEGEGAAVEAAPFATQAGILRQRPAPLLEEVR